MSKRTYEPSEYVAFCHRVTMSGGRRVAGEGDPADLAELVELRSTVEKAVVVAVRGLRERGWSWGQIAAELGVTRQAAQQVYGHRIAS